MHHLDFFGCVIGFRVTGYTRYKTSVGGYFTIIAAMLGIATIMVFSQEFIKREEPRNIIEDKKEYDPPQINLMAKNFGFAITTAFKDVNNLRWDIFKISAYYVKIQNSDTANEQITKINLIPCSDTFFKGLEDNYHKLNLNTALCADRSSSYINEQFNYFRVVFEFCNKNVDSTCKTMTEIESTLAKERPMAHVYFIDSSIDSKNYKTPISYFINNYNVGLTFGNMKNNDVKFMKSQLISFNNYFLNDKGTEYTALAYQGLRDKISVRTADRMDLLKINLVASNRQFIIKRSYIKFSEVLANIASIFNLIVLFCAQTVRYINEFLFVLDVLSNLFNYNDDAIRNFKSAKKMASSPLGKIIKEEKEKAGDLSLRIKTLKSLKNDTESAKPRQVNNFVKHTFTDDDKKREGDGEPKNNPKDPEPAHEIVQTYEMKNDGEIKEVLNEAAKPKSNFNPNKPKIQVETGANPGAVSKNRKMSKNTFLQENLINIIDNDTNSEKTLDRKQSLNAKNVEFHKFSKWDKFAYLFFRCFRQNFLKKQDMFYQTAKKEIEKYLDFKKFMKKVQEIDIIKYILFNEDQITLFNFISRPELSFKKMQSTKFAKVFKKYSSTALKGEEDINELSEKELKKILKCYSRIISKENLNEKDMRIIEALHPGVKQLLAIRTLATVK